MESTIQNLLTPASIATFGGASLAIMVVSNTIRILLKRDSPWIAFIVSLFISLLGAYAANSLKFDFADIGLAFVNGCLLFTSASGMQESAVKILTPKPIGETKPYGAIRVKWLSSWFHN